MTIHRTSIRLAGVFVCLVAFTALAYAADNQVGAWKLNLAKSKYSPANLAPKSTTSKIEAVDNGIKATVDTVDSEGKPFHYDFTAKYDGKEYPIKGDPTRDSVSYKKIDDYTF